MQKERSVIMVGCFDTKGEDFGYLYSCLAELGLNVITINTGIMGSTDFFPVNFEAKEVALSGGNTLTDLRENKDRGSAIEVMGNGAAAIVEDLFNKKKAHGIVGMGGGGGTFIALKAMQPLPFGFPKFCISTLATKDLSIHIGIKDITLMPSVVDVAGLNSISKVVMRQGAAAIVGMIKVSGSTDERQSKSIALSVFGNTTLCVDKCSELLRAKNYEVLAFHSVGVGGRTMEGLTIDGCIDAILDITTTELADELCGGICSAGPDRLTAAAKIGIPQIVVPGCLDMVNFGPLETVPEKYKDRQLFSWAPDVTLMRTNEQENRILGKTIAEKINKSMAPVIVLLPMGGLSKIGGPGEVFHNPAIDQELFGSLKSHANKNIKILEVNSNINTESFATQAVESLMEILRDQKN
ncbi:Tm-1-like ATP-binding domain-containing protein [Arenibacter sp. BSSL-BM3]|uniref:Tm-1-like ATP-binding domain-containing protein n=1 Tax=Arenibacter arenosicollis TaxID=2762274 RepID=A0ABR7QSP4_9FLAO|nr:Tm-1-like ATP-binding domain-containing protein [Arenibacter arenosicollis]MBC8770104.1 Tm-1-like ATP-binding domain-containing protein [Arenibacter arenosicollis]